MLYLHRNAYLVPTALALLTMTYLKTRGGVMMDVTMGVTIVTKGRRKKCGDRHSW